MTPDLIQINLTKVNDTLRKNGLHMLVDWLDTPDVMKEALSIRFMKLKQEGRDIPPDLNWIYSCYSISNSTQQLPWCAMALT